MLSHNSFSHTTNQSVFEDYLLHGTAPPEYVNTVLHILGEKNVRMDNLKKL